MSLGFWTRKLTEDEKFWGRLNLIVGFGLGSLMGLALWWRP